MGAGEQTQALSIDPDVPRVGRGFKTWARERSGLASATADEALLSALNLGLALVLIRGGSKTDYGVYSLVSGIIVLVRGAQSSMVLTPLATMGGRLKGDGRAAFIRALSQLQAGFGIIVALALAGGIWLFVGGAAWPLALGSGVALLGTWLREFRRGVALLEGRNGAALAGDALFGLLVCSAVFSQYLLSESMSATGMLVVTGLAAVAASVLGFPGLGQAAPTGRRAVARVALDQSRWSLPGTAVAWAQSSSYAYVVGLLLGSGAVGEISASRLFVVPLLLVGVAWGRTFLPHAAAILSAGREDAFLARCRSALRMALAGSLLYVALIGIAFALGAGHILPADYAGGGPQVAAWVCFAIISLCRSIASSALLARLQFRALFAMSVVTASATLLLVLALIGPLGTVGAIVGLAGGELLMAVLCWRFLLAGRSEP